MFSDRISYANISGALMFFFILAIFSVVLSTTTIIYCLRGIGLAPEERKSKYNVLILITIIINAIYIPAVINWHWLSATNPYDMSYHTVGYFGNIILLIIASAFVIKDKLFKPMVFIITMCLCFIYLAIGYMLGMMMGANEDSGNSLVMLSLLLGFGYSSIQVLLPLYYYYFRIPVEREKIYNQLPEFAAQISTTMLTSDMSAAQPPVITSATIQPVLSDARPATEIKPVINPQLSPVANTTANPPVGVIVPQQNTETNNENSFNGV